MWGSEYIIAQSLAPCSMCGRPTYFIDIFAESRICSEKCAKALDKQIWRAIRANIEAELYYSWEHGCTSEEWYDFLIELGI